MLRRIQGDLVVNEVSSDTSELSSDTSELNQPKDKDAMLKQIESILREGGMDSSSQEKSLKRISEFIG